MGKDADAVTDTEHLLTSDGKVIISGSRRFWDMRSKWVEDYLSEHVIEFLGNNGFEYIKIDYNETIGIGCDGAESYGEGIRHETKISGLCLKIDFEESFDAVAILLCRS